MTFPTTSVLDDFNTGANQNVTARAGWRSATWITTPLVTDAAPTYASIASGAAGGDWNTVFGADMEVWTTFASAATSIALYGRYDFAAGTGYVLTITGGSMTLNVWTAFNNAAAIGGSFSVTPASGDSCGLECIGTTISAYYKTAAGSWTQQVTGTDATYSSGALSIITFNTPSRFDSVGGGTVVTAGTSALSGPRQQSVPFTRGAGDGGRI